MENRSSTCREILSDLPAWFGIPEAIEEYASLAEAEMMLGYQDDGVVGGFVILRHTSNFATDVNVMAIRPQLHRRGIGRALIAAAEQWASESGRTYLTVKTLGPSRKSSSYDGTRAFYTAVGFVPLEELQNLWDGNPCLMMIKRIESSR